MKQARVPHWVGPVGVSWRVALDSPKLILEASLLLGISFLIDGLSKTVAAGKPDCPRLGISWPPHWSILGWRRLDPLACIRPGGVEVWSESTCWPPAEHWCWGGNNHCRTAGCRNASRPPAVLASAPGTRRLEASLKIRKTAGD